MAGAEGTAATNGAPEALHADAFKRLYPEQFYDRFIQEGLRPDGRALGVCRPVTVGLGAVASADGSALVKVGATTVLAGVRLEVALPSTAAPDSGQLLISIEQTPLASADWRPGRSNDASEVLTASVSDALLASDAFDPRQLCIAPGQAMWVAYLELYVLDADGSLLDAALLAAVAALTDARLPAVRVTEEGNVERDSMGTSSSDGQLDDQRRLLLGRVPLCLTVGLYKGHLLADPTAEEAALLDGSVSVVLDPGDGALLGVLKPGGSSTATPQLLLNCVEMAKARCKEVYAQLSQAAQQAASNDMGE